MDQGLEDPQRPQDPGHNAQDDRSHHSPFHFRNTKIANAAASATRKIKTTVLSETQDGTNRLAEQAEHITQSENGYGNGPGITDASNRLDIVCGPLLNYKGMSNAGSTSASWHGSVLIVAKPGQHPPDLGFRYRGPYSRSASSNPDRPTTGSDTEAPPSFRNSKTPLDCRASGVKLYEDPVKAFWRFDLDLPLRNHEASWEYSLPNMYFPSGANSRCSPSSRTFVVPSISHSMRILFHSCNGFSVGTDEDAWSGPALWNDVLRLHEQKPFHVMIGGGDQIYNDGVRVTGPLKPWTDMLNPKKRREFPFDEGMRAACDSYYFNHYVEWYSADPFASANGQIAQINIWDDHGTIAFDSNFGDLANYETDIIDGFGSYTDNFMNCAVFRGIGGIAFKYYCLFQHHIPPQKSTFTTSAPQTMGSQPGADPAQLADTFVLKEQDDARFIIGASPGPYVSQRSHSLYMRLGARMGFLGIDARTERTRHQVNYPETYDLIFERVKFELSSASAGLNKMTHLIVLLGIPIAYPRLIWLENIFTSPIIGPIRFLSKRFGIAGGLFNKFDGQVDLLDDLDDHYTARQHKKERKDLLLRLQTLAEDFSIRISILGGDVHLAALGRFYAKPKLSIPIDRDHRYMVNIISSAITNHPPPKAVADLLARRNKIHHLDHDTDETLMKIFNKDPGNTMKTAPFNKVTMPSRNYAIISESYDPTKIASSNTNLPNIESLTNGHAISAQQQPEPSSIVDPPLSTKDAGHSNDGHSPLGPGEEGAGTQHPAASGVNDGDGMGGLDVCLRVEISQHDKEGRTEGYGFTGELQYCVLVPWHPLIWDAI